MVCRKRQLRAGLLIFFLLLAFVPSGYSQSNAGENTGGKLSGDLEVRIESSPSNPAVNGSWSLFILIDHPVPSQVTVKPPRFPASIILERVRTDARTFPQGARWTRVEFLFTPTKAGSITIEPFEIMTPDRLAKTGSITVRFQEDPKTAVRFNPRFRWIEPIPSVPLGERGELILELTGWNPEMNAPSGFFRGRAPLNAILEDPLPGKTGEGIYRYAIGIIPLEESDIILDALAFQAEGFSLNVPGITVPVLPAVFGQAEAGEPVEQSKEDHADPEEITGASGKSVSSAEAPSEDIFSLPFPSYSENVFPLFHGEYGRIIEHVKDLWENQSRVKALAEIRRSERDSFAGPSLAPLRREMEQVLDLGFTEDEKWRPLKISLLLWFVLGFLIFSALLTLLFFKSGFRFRRKNVTSRRQSGFKTIIVLVFSIGLALILLEERFGNLLAGRLSSTRNTAVLERTSAYRVPDLSGAVNTVFAEGQPVTINDFQQDWCYAETADGRAGWVPREAVIIY